MKFEMLLVLATMMGSSFAQGADLYVSTNGNDSNPGTQAAPVKTISQAARLATAGTTVHVAPGIYTGNVSTSKSGTKAARIRYVSDTKWGAKIIGTGTDYHWDNRGSYVDIVGFDVSGPGRGGILNYGSYTLMAENHVHDLKVSGGCTGAGGAGIVNANYEATDGDIIGNVVHDVGVPGSCIGVQGIYHSVLRGKIMNNISYRNSAYGIHLWHAANETVIMNNTVFNNGSSKMGGGIVVGRGDSGVGVMINTHIVNNIVYDNPLYSIIQYCYSGFNCIGSGNTVKNNIIYSNGRKTIMLAGAPEGTIEADPQFIDYKEDGSGNYHLKSTSPAIDRGLASAPADSKGVVTLAPATDFDDNSRQQGSAVDIGAYEFLSASPTPLPTAGVKLSPSAISFGSVAVGETSSVKYVKVTNSGSSPLNLQLRELSGDFVSDPAK